MRFIFIILAAQIILSSCSSSTRKTEEQVEPLTKVRVKNQNWSDMSIYILYGSQRYRLGMVPGLETRVFIIPERLVTGVSSIRFLADPIGGRATPVTQELAIFPGEEISLLISH